MTLTLTSKHTEIADVVSFIFTPEEGFTWQAGQFLTLFVPHENPDSHGTEHFFTIASAPYEGIVQITTRLTGSTFKNALNALPLGATLEAKEPEGEFVLDNPVGEYVFIAGGIGITPIRSILKQLDHEGKPISATLLYGNRTEEAVFKDELADIAAKNPHLKIHYIISPEQIDDVTVRKYIPDVTTPTFYISGPEPMVEALEKTFAEKLGLTEEQMVRDYFPGYDQHNF
jgi:ferredoxin-NADP reductase